MPLRISVSISVSRNSDREAAQPVSAAFAVPAHFGGGAWVGGGFVHSLFAEPVPQKLPTGLGGLALSRLPFQVEAATMGAEHVTINRGIK
jgi:hypothetical protein